MRFSERFMNQMGVEVINGNGLKLECVVCRMAWHLVRKSGGPLPRGYWKCPGGCNEPQADAASR